MERNFIPCIFGAALLAMGLTAAAQAPPEQITNPYYSQDEYQVTHSMFDKIQADLNYATTNAYPNNLGDTARFDVARNELQQLEQSWDRGQYDSRQLDLTTSAIQMVLNDNRLVLHDREALTEDLTRLGEFRAEYY